MARARRRTKREAPPRRSRIHKGDATQVETPQAEAAATSLPIVAIGASAGGLEAFTQILDDLPADPRAAIVFVQHLSPQHESALPALLAPHAKLHVVQAASGMPLEPNHVYVMPPNVQMKVADGTLQMLPRPRDRTQFTPIDTFLESLAHWAQERAIAVILSGTASDGAIGIREIKALGGVTIAQQPESAKFDSMPRAAIATGLIDLVLTPAEIAAHIRDVRHHPSLVAAAPVKPGAGIAPTADELRDLFTMLRRASGIDFQEYKTPTVMRRLLRRLALMRFSDMNVYLRYMREHAGEASTLSQDLLIHVTRFFREPESFKALSAVFPDIVNAHPDQTIRVWVPGCATGEEAYSIAIALVEHLGDRMANHKVQVFATDVSEASIEHARAGVYPAGIAADVSPEQLRMFFTKEDGGYRVSKTLRDICIFARHDLAQDPPFSRLDLIVCRNVLIYLDGTLQKRLMSIFHYALRPQGFLMLGPAETPGVQAWFGLVDKRWRIYRQITGATDAPMGFSSMSRPSAKLPRTSTLPQAAVTHEKPMQEEANRLVLDRYAPPGVVVDGNFDIVQFRGRTGPFLEAASGDPSLNVLKMARGGLLHALRSALQGARRKRRPVRKERVMVQHEGDWQTVTLEVVPLTGMRGDYLLVLFEPAASEAPAGRDKKPKRRPSLAARKDNGRVSDLRRELMANREYLQSIIQELEAANEELQSANEEILSSNEELQSTNEELDTAKEELQSTNEELNTLNEELHSRNEELARVNSDLVNLLASVDFPIVIVGDDLAIRRFTPMAEQIFNLIPGDIGRPIGQIKPNIQVDNLETLIRQTIDGVTTREHEVQDRQGRWFSLRVRPYKGPDNRLDGAVIAAIDIDGARRHQRVVARAREYILTIVETVRQPLLVLDTDLRVQRANQTFLDQFRISAREADGRVIDTLGGAQWDIPALRETLASVASGEEQVRALTLEHEFPSVGFRRLRLSARRLEVDEEQPWILVAIEDVTGASQSGA